MSLWVYCVPGPENWGRNTRLAASSHEFCVEVGNWRIDRYGSCFFLLFAGSLWNSLPPSTFPSSYDLRSFKSRVYHIDTCEPLIINNIFLFLFNLLDSFQHFWYFFRILVEGPWCGPFGVRVRPQSLKKISP